MILKISPEFKKSQLTKDSYSLVQKSGNLSYSNIRFIKASLPWECIGATHEYWSCREKPTKEHLSTIWIDDQDDGGCKSDKFERDVLLLKKGLEEEPDNARYMFYLAQSYWRLNNTMKQSNGMKKESPAKKEKRRFGLPCMR